MTWFEEVFLPATAHLRTPETPVVLVFDGFEAHTDLLLRDVAAEQHVELLLLPPHATHLLQPLDVNNMGPLKAHYGTAVNIWRVANPWKVINVPQLLALLSDPFKKNGQNHASPWDSGLSPHNIRGGFQKTGLIAPNLPPPPSPRPPLSPIPAPATVQPEPALGKNV